jgi:hypothetical protein
MVRYIIFRKRPHMDEIRMETIFSKVHHVSFSPGSRFNGVKGSVGLVYHDPHLEDAVLFWNTLLRFTAYAKALIIDRISIETIKLTLLIDNDDDALVLTAPHAKCQPVKLDLFLKNHPHDLGLNLHLKLHTPSLEEARGYDPSLGTRHSIWVEKWKGKG